MTLEEVDLFKALGLEQLSEEEKDKYVGQLTEMALKMVATEDLPLFMTEEEINQFNEEFEQEATRHKAVDFLYTKFPEVDEALKEKMLALKKELIRANVVERLEIKKGEGNTAEQDRLEKILKAIDEDEWDEYEK